MIRKEKRRYRQVMFFQRKDVKEQKIEELLLENYNRYYRLAYSYVHNEADAADIVQNLSLIHI